MPDRLTATAPARFELAPEDIRPDLSTREARVKWVMVIDPALGPGLIANTAGCLAAAVGKELPGIIGPGAEDASGADHPGLPWTGCSVLGADPATLRAVRDKARAKSGVHVVDMPRSAQAANVYTRYVEALAEIGTEEIEYQGISLLGPRNKVAKLTGRLPLLA
ncbi:DUF2000 domain-containing protein [Nocardiopsis potens]|uniref:DUF2000 domain-containing protein n=1 Tax=Nocardiopsis potens TaxID=1246458 RepID=UPI00034A752D|nr:DUF2000 domain-containing protein [Nocardiopsis potens]